jgi:uncharacterized protein
MQRKGDMLVSARTVTIPIGPEDFTSGVLLTPASPRSNHAVIIAHGAGNDMNEPRIAAFSQHLSQAGYVTLRFNFLYRERGRKAPDREEVLMTVWTGAHRFLLESSGARVRDVIAAGKSMGGRIASEMVARGTLAVKRLILLGYPLHSPGNPNRLHDEHLANIRVPMLFFAGTRDSLCKIDRLKTVLGRLHTDWELSIIEGGDHSFHLPQRMGIDEAEVDRYIAEKTLEWLAE